MCSLKFKRALRFLPPHATQKKKFPKRVAEPPACYTFKLPPSDLMVNSYGRFLKNPDWHTAACIGYSE